MLNLILIGAGVIALVVVLIAVLSSFVRSYRAADPSTSDYSYDEIYKIIGMPTILISSPSQVARAVIKLKYGQVVSVEVRELKLENNRVLYQGYTVAEFEPGKGLKHFNPNIMVDLGQEMRFEIEYHNFSDIQPPNATSKEVQILK